MKFLVGLAETCFEPLILHMSLYPPPCPWVGSSSSVQSLCFLGKPYLTAEGLSLCSFIIPFWSVGHLVLWSCLTFFFFFNISSMGSFQWRSASLLTRVEWWLGLLFLKVWSLCSWRIHLGSFFTQVQLPANIGKADFSFSFTTLDLLLDFLLCFYFSFKGYSLCSFSELEFSKEPYHVINHSTSLVTLGDSPNQRNSYQQKNISHIEWKNKHMRERVFIFWMPFSYYYKM